MPWYNNQTFTSWPTTWNLSWHRTAKYKQRRQIFSREHLKGLPNIQSGACVGLSFAWIVRHTSRPLEAAGLRCQSLNPNCAYDQHNNVSGIFNRGGHTYLLRVQAAATRVLGTVAANVIEVDEVNFVTFNAVLGHLNAHPGYHVVNMQFPESPTGHLIALHQGATHLVVFDPNSGEYRIANADRQAFFLALKRQYLTYVKSNGEAMPLTISDFDIFYLP